MYCVMKCQDYSRRIYTSLKVVWKCRLRKGPQEYEKQNEKNRQNQGLKEKVKVESSVIGFVLEAFIPSIVFFA